MTLSQFKKAHNIDTLSFYPSKVSSRFVAAFGVDQLLITTEDFDPKGLLFVYSNPTDVSGNSHILSNQAPKEASFTL